MRDVQLSRLATELPEERERLVYAFLAFYVCHYFTARMERWSVQSSDEESDQRLEQSLATNP